MRRVVLSWRWLALHVFALAVIAGCLRLGWWQLDRARSASGTIQNMGYAGEWPIFAGFAAFMWIKMVREELHPRARSPADGSPDAGDENSSGDGRWQLGSNADAGPDEEPDEELDAYNRYLAELHARAQAHQR
ncbi:MAG TPA: transcriptional regulator [Mycobacteriales bacterium]|nr:transcriptional regulator [Mycobacteriales bacterium]